MSVHLEGWFGLDHERFSKESHALEVAVCAHWKGVDQPAFASPNFTRQTFTIDFFATLGVNAVCDAGSAHFIIHAE